MKSKFLKRPDLSKTELKLSRGRASKKLGFTMIELLVVIAIIGVLAAIVLVNMQESRKTANDGAISSSLTQVKNAAEVYYNDNYNYTNICDGSGKLNAGIVDFVRIGSYITDRKGVVVCRSTVTGWAVASSLNKGGCWCVDYQGRSQKFNTGAGQTCADVLAVGVIICP
jgi:prepilin-type N-terminal cleavage/methylation domain-containing protein